MNNELKNNIVLIILGLLISIFIPSDFFYVIRSFLFYFLWSSVIYWYCSVIYFIAVLYFIRKSRGSILTKKFIFSKSIFIHLAIILTFNFIVSTISALYSEVRAENMKVVYAGCYTQNNAGLLLKDNESKKIDNLFEYEFNHSASSHQTYKKGICSLQKIEIPDFIMLTTKIQDIREKIFRKINLNRVFCVIYFIRNQDNSKIDVHVDYNKQVMDNQYIYDRFSYMFTSISKDENINYEILIKSVSNFYVAISGQAVLSCYILEKQYLDANRVLIDSENQIISASNFLLQYGNESTKKKIQDLRNFWLADLERYKANIQDRQTKKISSINHFFNSLYYDFYYPQESYEEMKYKLLNDYEKSIESINEKNLATDLQPTIEYIKDILISQNNSETTNAILNRFETLNRKFSDNPLYWYYYGEIIKFCKTDGKKYNKIYINRIDESIVAFKKAIELDPTFSLVYAKLCGLKSIQSELTTDSIKSRKLKEESQLYIENDPTLYDLFMRN